MAIRSILLDKDPVLKKKCHPITHFNRTLYNLLDDLKETLTEANGAGLAAPQVGILRRVCIVVDDDDNMVELVNPVLLTQEGEEDGFEGCLSVPGLWGKVKRPTKVRVRAQDRRGDFFELDGEGMVARCLCHEIEHLDGHLYTEHVDKLYTTEEFNQLLEEEEQNEA